MTLRSRAWIAAACAAAAIALSTLLVLPSPPFAVPVPAWAGQANEVRGAFHIHTRRSDGTGSVEEVAAAAARARLQFIIITDHGDGTRRPEPPSYHSGVLCIDALEISTTGGHYAALGLGQAPYPLAGEPRDVAEDVRRLGGFGVATHPLSDKADLAWRDWSVPVDAIEWLNGDSVWRDAPTSRLAGAAWTYLFRPVASLARLYGWPATLAKWDQLSRGGRIIALAGTDAHARLGFRDGPEPYVNPLYLKVPSYRVAFQLASLRVRLPAPLSKTPDVAANALETAIRAGRLHTVVDALGSDGAFAFTATSGGVTAGEGDALALNDPAVIRVRSNPPPGGSLVLYRNGTQVHAVEARELVYATDREGTYRAEVRVPGPAGRPAVPWIVGNPIVLGPVPVTLPSAPAWGETVATLDEGAEIWGVERDRDSTAALERSGGLTLSYRLAPGATAPYAALGATTSIDASAGSIAFLGQANRPMRVSVQLRVPKAGDGFRWQRSVYLDTTPREVVVPFVEMTPLGATPAGAPQVADVRTVLFVVDGVNAKPGTAGRFLVRDIRLLGRTGGTENR